jgi:hypothetical protein
MDLRTGSEKPTVVVLVITKPTKKRTKKSQPAKAPSKLSPDAARAMKFSQQIIDAAATPAENAS